MNQIIDKTQDKLLSLIKEEVTRLKLVEGKDNWSYVRDYNNYNMLTIQYSFGKRIVLEPIDKQIYYDLQASRGISFTNNFDSDIKRIKNEIEHPDGEHAIRIYELEQLTKENIIIIQKDKFKFAELGFRQPMLLKHFISQGVESFGYDVVPVNVLIGQYLGYDTRLYNFSDCSEELDLKDAYMISSYHMLEHTQNPLAAIQLIYESMEHGAYLHVEIPVEPSVPEIQHGHLYAFNKDDLRTMLDITGFSILYVLSSESSSGRKIERCLAYKR